MLTDILYLYLFLKSDILCCIVPTNRLYILSILDSTINDPILVVHDVKGYFLIKYIIPNMTLETSKINFTNQFLCSFSFLIASSEFHTYGIRH